MNTLKYIGRVIGKLAALGFIFVGGGVLAITIFPLAACFPGDNPDRTQRIIQNVFRFYLWVLQKVGLIKLEIQNATHFLNLDGKIVIANHPSLLDVVILFALIPRAQCIIKHELWNHRFLGVLMRRAGYIRNDLEPEEMIARCKASLDAGRCLIIFPEGTRTPPGSLPHFQRGFANIALLTATPIQPIFIDCTPSFLFKGEPWWHYPPQKPFFDISLGECLDAGAYFLYGQRSLAARNLVKSLEFYYAEHGRD